MLKSSECFPFHVGYLVVFQSPAGKKFYDGNKAIKFFIVSRNTYGREWKNLQLYGVIRNMPWNVGLPRVPAVDDASSASTRSRTQRC